MALLRHGGELALLRHGGELTSYERERRGLAGGVASEVEAAVVRQLASSGWGEPPHDSDDAVVPVTTQWCQWLSASPPRSVRASAPFSTFPSSLASSPVFTLPQEPSAGCPRHGPKESGDGGSELERACDEMLRAVGAVTLPGSRAQVILSGGGGGSGVDGGRDGPATRSAEACMREGGTFNAESIHGASGVGGASLDSIGAFPDWRDYFQVAGYEPAPPERASTPREPALPFAQDGDLGLPLHLLLQEVEERRASSGTATAVSAPSICLRCMDTICTCIEDGELIGMCTPLCTSCFDLPCVCVLSGGALHSDT
jgi:hypothetical protein